MPTGPAKAPIEARKGGKRGEGEGRIHVYRWPVNPVCSRVTDFSHMFSVRRRLSNKRPRLSTIQSQPFVSVWFAPPDGFPGGGVSTSPTPVCENPTSTKPSILFQSSPRSTGTTANRQRRIFLNAQLWERKCRCRARETRRRDTTPPSCNAPYKLHQWTKVHSKVVSRRLLQQKRARALVPELWKMNSWVCYVHSGQPPDATTRLRGQLGRPCRV